MVPPPRELPVHTRPMAHVTAYPFELVMTGRWQPAEAGRICSVPPRILTVVKCLAVLRVPLRGRPRRATCMQLDPLEVTVAGSGSSITPCSKRRSSSQHRWPQRMIRINGNIPIGQSWALFSSSSESATRKCQVVGLRTCRAGYGTATFECLSAL